MTKKLLALSVLFLCGGCSLYMREGMPEFVDVNTNLTTIPNATVTTKYGTRAVEIPGRLSFLTSYSDVEINTAEDECHYASSTTISSELSPWFLFGNFVFGPFFFVGMFYDFAAGEAFVYPDEIMINIQKKENC